MQFGIRSVSMDAIANALGMSKKTLYQFFTDKDELVLAVVENHIIAVEKNCEKCIAEGKNAIHEIFITMDNIMQQLGKMNPMALYDMEKFHFKAFQRFLEHKNNFLVKVLKNNIEAGIRQELYRQDLQVDVLSKFRVESMMIPFNLVVFPFGKYNLADNIHIVLENFIYGLATIKGHKLIHKYIEQRKKQQKDETHKI